MTMKNNDNYKQRDEERKKRRTNELNVVRSRR